MNSLKPMMQRVNLSAAEAGVASLHLDDRVDEFS
jgi:hypothetical protein